MPRSVNLNDPPINSRYLPSGETTNEGRQPFAKRCKYCSVLLSLRARYIIPVTVPMATRTLERLATDTRRISFGACPEKSFASFAAWRTSSLIGFKRIRRGNRVTVLNFGSANVHVPQRWQRMRYSPLWCCSRAWVVVPSQVTQCNGVRPNCAIQYATTRTTAPRCLRLYVLAKRCASVRNSGVSFICAMRCHESAPRCTSTQTWFSLP